MKKIFLAAGLLILFSKFAFAQSEIMNMKDKMNYFTNKVAQPIDTLLGWRHGALVNVGLAQSSLDHWAAGGEKFSLSIDGMANFFANYRLGKVRWDNNLAMSYGMITTTSEGMRKTNDNFDVTSKYGYRFSRKWYAGALADFRTQFANGYLYPEDTIVSHAFAPAYGLIALGFNYQPADYFSLFLSPLTSRFTIVADQRLANAGAYGVDTAVYKYNNDGTKTLVSSGKKLAYQLGAYLSAQFSKEIVTNINWTTRLDLFSNYLKNPQNINVYWTSVIAMKVNKYITVNLSTELIYDDNVRIWQNENGVYGPRTQFKELLGVGFAYQFVK